MRNKLSLNCRLGQFYWREDYDNDVCKSRTSVKSCCLDKLNYFEKFIKLVIF